MLMLSFRCLPLGTSNFSSQESVEEHVCIVFDRHIRLMVGIHVKTHSLAQQMRIDLARALLLPQGANECVRDG